MMWFNFFNPFAWVSMLNPPAQPNIAAPVDEEDLPEDLDLAIDEDFEEATE
jgi:hypothetical protein